MLCYVFVWNICEYLRLPGQFCKKRQYFHKLKTYEIEKMVAGDGIVLSVRNAFNANE